MPTPTTVVLERLHQAVRAAITAAGDPADDTALEAALAEYYAAVQQLREQLAA